MLDMTWKAGKVTVVACKGYPGMAFWIGKGDRHGAVMFNESGIDVKTFKSEEPPLACMWLPMFTALGPVTIKAEDMQRAIAKMRAAVC